MTIYYLNVDLVYDNVHTNIGLNKSICSQDIKKNDLWCQSRPVTLLQICENWQFTIPNVDLVNDNVYTKFGYFLSIHVNSMFLNKLS